MNTLTFLMIVILAISTEINCQQCRTSSDLGGTECVLLTPYYTEYQWATCLTDDYIRERSSERHYCRNSAVRCWYQCQLEINGLDSGDVYTNCRCSPGDSRPTSPPDLDPECFSPDGSSCTWYRECLEVRYPCEGTRDGYAIEFAEKFCNLYTNNFNTFSTNAQNWIDGVRRCLQVALVPSLRPWIQKTCAEIRTDAFNTHSPCYLTPGSGAPSVCSLPIRDQWNIFWLVFRNTEFQSTAVTDTGTQMIEVMSGCTKQFGANIARTVELKLRNVLSLVNPAETASSVGKYFADLLDFDNKGIGWFPLDRQSDSPRQRRQLTEAGVMLLVASLQSLDVPTSGTGRMYSVDEIVSEMADAVRNGELSNIPITVGNTEVVVGVSSMGGCEDLLCNGTNITVLATSSAAPPAPNTLTVLNIVVTLCALFAAAR